MTRANILAVAVTVSLALHLVLFLMVPGMRLTLPASTETVVEVEVAEPQPEPPPEPEPPPQPLEPKEAQAPPLAPAAAESLSELLAGAVATAPLPPPTAPAVRLPRREALLPEPDTLSWSVSPPPGPSTLPRASLPRMPVPGAPDLAAAEGLAQRLLEAAAQAPEAAAPRSLDRLKIEWQKGVDRRVTHEPPAPSVPIRNPADVRIQFWVSPRGTVTRAEVLQTADPDLDRAALAYVKAFRFNDLPSGQDQEQWGTIRVSFRLE